MKTLYRAYSATFTESWKQSWSTFRISISKEKTDNFKMNMNHNRHGRMILPSVTEKRIWRRDPADNPPPPASPGPADIDSASDSSPVVSLSSHPLLLASAVRYARRRLVTSLTRHFNYVCPAFVTECLVTDKKSRATFSTNKKRNENPFVCASIFDWFIRLSTYAVFHFFHTRLMYWLFTICLMVQVERQDRWRKFSKSSDYMATDRKSVV